MTHTPDVENCCLIAGFMWGGVKEDDTLLEHWGNGCLELCQEVTQYATLADEMLQACFEAVPNLDVPGVFDYEVSEPFGAWFREYIVNSSLAYPPSFYLAADWLEAKIARFFAEPGSETHTVLSNALRVVRDNYLESHHD